MGKHKRESDRDGDLGLMVLVVEDRSSRDGGCKNEWLPTEGTFRLELARSSVPAPKIGVYHV
jgi:hypothetical protein